VPDETPQLTSTQNSHVKFARSLHVRKHRQQERAFIVESSRLFLDALSSGALPDRVFVDLERASEEIRAALEALTDSGIPVHPCSPAVISAVSDTSTPQGIVGIFPIPEIPFPLNESEPLFVVADGLKDPGNLGTMMRSALGAGATALYTSPETVDAYSPKVVRAGMGAHFRLPLRVLSWETIPPELADCTLKVRAEANGAIHYDELDWSESAVLVVGSETGGISASAREFTSIGVSIPLQGHVESLNAATASAVILFEAARQRRAQ